MRIGRDTTACVARALLALFVVAGGTAARAAVVLNEVLYDPAGADAGREFVELFNPEPAPVCLAGYRIEFANGAEAAPAWATRWTGATRDTIAARGWFLVGDEGWSGPAADATAPLALQNGPDAVRLQRPGGDDDRLGYGALTAAAFAEGTPHAVVHAGSSLARRPDGRDTDDNGADWAALAVPTPGGPNFAMRAAVVEGVVAEPPVAAAAGWPVSLAVRVLNTGLEALPAAAVRLIAAPAAGATGPAGADTAGGWLEATEPAEARVLSFAWTPRGEGLHRLRLEIPADSCGAGIGAQAGAYQVGPAGPYISEVMGAPPAGAGEWVELGNAGPGSAALGALRWRDEDGAWRSLPPRWLAPGEFVVLAADCGELRAWWRDASAAGAPDCDAAALAGRCLEPTGSWPSLNNTPPRDRAFADRVWLADSTGVVLDCALLGADGLAVPRGRSLERAHTRPQGHPDRNWGPCTAPAGATPGCVNSLTTTAPDGAEPALRPNPFAPAAGSLLHIVFTLAEDDHAWDARIFDLWGRRVRDLGGDTLGPGPRDVAWDGRDDGGEGAASGGYVVVVRRFTRDGALVGSARRLAVVSDVEARP